MSAAELQPDLNYREKASPVTKKRRAEVVAIHGATCNICGDEIDLTLDRNDNMALSMDHLIPRYYGGTNAIENLRPAHRRCNSSKSWRLTSGGRPLGRRGRKAMIAQRDGSGR